MRAQSEAGGTRLAAEAKRRQAAAAECGELILAVRTKGALSQKTAKLMVFTLVQAAARKWRRLKGANQLPLVVEGIIFNDGVASRDADKSRAA